MHKHPFIFSPSCWLGEGKIHLNSVDEELIFFTRWNISQEGDKKLIECTQEIQVKGISDVMINEFSMYDFGQEKFTVELENQALGKIIGTGVIGEKVIGWEFRAPEIGFEGFEFYELQPDNTYEMRAEYASADEFRTTIRGKVWQKATPEEKA
jgi:hypothetical protein